MILHADVYEYTTQHCLIINLSTRFFFYFHCMDLSHSLCHTQDTTQDQFLCGVQLILIYGFPSPRLVAVPKGKESSQPYNLPIPLYICLSLLLSISLTLSLTHFLSLSPSFYFFLSHSLSFSLSFSLTLSLSLYIYIYTHIGWER